MMRVAVLTVAMAMAFPLVALSNPVKKKDDDEKKKKFFDEAYIGFNFSPEFLLMNNLSTDQVTTYSYIKRFSYQFGFDGYLQFGERFLLSGGVHWATRSFRRITECATCESEVRPESNFKLKFFEVPVSAMYLLANDKMDVFASLGFVNSITRSVTEDMTGYDGKTYRFNPNSQFAGYSLNGQAGVGFAYSINLHLSAGMDVKYTYPLMDLSNDPALRYSFMSLGTSFYYKF